MSAIKPLTKPVLAIPANIKLRFLPPNPARISLDSIFLLERWTPFVAACVFMGFTPSEINHDLGDVEAIWEIVPENEDHSGEHLSEYSHQLRQLTQVIAINAAERGEQDLSPAEVVAWAIKTDTISSDSKVARKFNLDRSKEVYFTAVKGSTTSEDIVRIEDLTEDLRLANEKIAHLTREIIELKGKSGDTGKHFIEQRAMILAAALHRLAKNRKDCSDKSGKVTGARLAKEVDDHRTSYGFSYKTADASPVAGTIQKHVTDALSETYWSKLKIIFSHP